MNLHLHHLVIHELSKEPGSNEVELFLSEQPVPADDNALRLVEKLNAPFYLSEDTLNGSLKKEEGSPVPRALQTLFATGLSAAAFLEFSREAMQSLQYGLQGVVGAKGGYFVFAHYDQVVERRQSYHEQALKVHRPQLGIFLLRDTDGLIFSRTPGTNSFQLDTVTYLNMEKLAMAALIDIDRYHSEWPKGDDEQRERYVRMIRYARSQKEISDYFVNWIGLDREESNRELTQTFVAVVNGLPLPVDPETGEVMEESDFLEEVHQFVTAGPQKTVNLREFDQHFYQDEQVVQNYLAEKELSLDNEFPYDRGLVNKLHHLRVSADGVSLGRLRSDFSNGRITLEGQKVIIHSEELVERIAEFFAGGR